MKCQCTENYCRKWGTIAKDLSLSASITLEPRKFVLEIAAALNILKAWHLTSKTTKTLERSCIVSCVPRMIWLVEDVLLALIRNVQMTLFQRLIKIPPRLLNEEKAAASWAFVNDLQSSSEIKTKNKDRNKNSILQCCQLLQNTYTMVRFIFWAIPCLSKYKKHFPRLTKVGNTGSIWSFSEMVGDSQ